LRESLFKAAESSGAVQTQDGAIHVNGPTIDELLDDQDQTAVKEIAMKRTVINAWQSPASRRASDDTSSKQTTEL
jgi:hypothetical protein